MYDLLTISFIALYFGQGFAPSFESRVTKPPPKPIPLEKWKQMVCVPQMMWLDYEDDNEVCDDCICSLGGNALMCSPFDCRKKKGNWENKLGNYAPLEIKQCKPGLKGYFHCDLCICGEDKKLDLNNCIEKVENCDVEALQNVINATNGWYPFARFGRFKNG